MIETKLKWTVYVGGRLLDVMTDEQVEEMVQIWKVVLIDARRGLIEF